MVLVHLIRHAQSVTNIDYSIIQGRATETPLSAVGENQPGLLARLAHQEGIIFDEWYSSPALRALKTALGVREKLFPIYCEWQVLPEIKILDDLHEVDQGAWTGRKVRETYTPEFQHAVLESGGTIGPPGGETMVLTGQRMRSCLEGIAGQAAQRSEKTSIAAFTHNNAIACFLFNLGLPIQEAWNLKLKNTSMTILEYSKPGGWNLLKIGYAPHMEGTG